MFLSFKWEMFKLPDFKITGFMCRHNLFISVWMCVCVCFYMHIFVFLCYLCHHTRVLSSWSNGNAFFILFRRIAVRIPHRVERKKGCFHIVTGVFKVNSLWSIVSSCWCPVRLKDQNQQCVSPTPILSDSSTLSAQSSLVPTEDINLNAVQRLSNDLWFCIFIKDYYQVCILQ